MKNNIKMDDVQSVAFVCSGSEKRRFFFLRSFSCSCCMAIELDRVCVRVRVRVSVSTIFGNMLNWTCRRLMSLSALMMSTKMKRNSKKIEKKQHHKKRPFHPEDEIEHMRTGYSQFSSVLLFGSEFLKYETRKTLNNLNWKKEKERRRESEREWATQRELQRSANLDRRSYI